MDTHLIIAVHGIGEQQPGETVDEIVSAATTQHIKDDPLFQPVTVDRDVVELAEERFGDDGPRIGTFFPVNLRNVQSASSDEVTERAVFSEVFWADKSPAPHGPFWTIFDLLKIVLGLGYLAMENAESNRGKFSVGLVHAFTWVFYGLVAPMNAMLVVGCLILLLDLTPLWDQLTIETMGWVVLAHGFCTLAIGFSVRYMTAQTYLMRIFGNGLCLIGSALLLVFVAAKLSVSFNTAFCVPVQLPDASQTPTLIGHIDCYARFLLRMLGASWVTTVALALIIAIVGFTGALAGRVRTKFPMRKGKSLEIIDQVSGIRTIYPSICAAMVLFWSVIASSLWLLLLNISSQLSNQVIATRVPASLPKADEDEPLGEQAGTTAGNSIAADGSETNGADLTDAVLSELVFSIKPTSLLYTALDVHMRTVLQTMSVTTGVVILIIFVTAILVGIRKARPKGLYKMAEWRSRLILNPVLHVLFMVSLAIIALALIFTSRAVSIANNDAGATGECLVETGPLTILCWFHDQNAAVTGLLLLLGIIIYRLSHHVSGGLGIFRDIVTYSVQESCAWQSNRKERAKNFSERVQINARFRRTLHYGLESLSPKRVTIIAHSLGSVIATQMLMDPDVKALLKKNGNPDVVLITMGSPVTHIYRRYFKEFFQVSTDDMPLASTPDGAVNKAWYNIHREDDFVGTRIGDDPVDTPDLAQNFPVEPGGHTGYFTDYHVWKVLRDQIGFRLFPSQFMTRRREAAE